jgi:hypothetical protein
VARGGETSTPTQRPPQPRKPCRKSRRQARRRVASPGTTSTDPSHRPCPGRPRFSVTLYLLCKARRGRLLGPLNEVRTVTQEPTGLAVQHEQVSRLFQTLQGVDAEVVER